MPSADIYKRRKSMPRRFRYAIAVLCFIVGLSLTHLIFDASSNDVLTGASRFRRSIDIIAAIAAVSLIFWVILEHRRRSIRLLDDEIIEKYMEVAKTAVVFLRPDQSIRYVNPALLRILGYEVRDLVGETWSKFLPASHRDTFQQIFEDLIRGRQETTRYFESPVIARDGRRCLIAWHNTALKDRKGKAIGVLSLGEDITQRSKHEEHVRCLSSALETSSESVIISNFEGEITHVNSAALRLWGYSDEDQVIGRRMVDLLAPEHRQRAAQEFDDVRTDGLPASSRYEIITSGGSKIPVEISSAVMRDNDGNPLGMVAIVKDITQCLATEERLSIAASLGSDLVYEWDLATDCLTWYGDIESMLGYPPGEVPRTVQEWLALIHPEDRKCLRSAVKHHRTSSKPIRYEYRIRHKNGLWLYWVDKGQAVLDTAGKPVRWIGVCNDVTAQRKAEEALRKSEEKYRLVSENIPVVVYSTLGDVGAKCLFVSGRVRHLTGYSSSEFLENPDLWKAIIHPEDRRSVIENIRQRLANKTTISEEYRIVTRLGETKWVRYKATPMLDEEGSIIRIDGFMEDISERKLAELSLQRSERELRVAHQIASCFLLNEGDGIWQRILEINLDTLGSNYACLGLFCDGGRIAIHTLCATDAGTSYESVTVDRNQVQAIWKESLEAGRGLVSNTEVLSPDARRTLKQAVAAPLVLNTSLVGIIGAGDRSASYGSQDCQMLECMARALSPLVHERLQRDAKERERARIQKEKQAVEAQLQQAQKMEALGSLAGGIAHEFNNLLATIRGYTELVLSKVSKDGSIAADLRQVKKASDRAADLTRQLLLFGRSHPMEATIVDINSVVSGMSAMLSRLIGENITIETELDPRVWRIKADRRNIEQVIINLVLNSKEAMPDGGKIVISTYNTKLTANLEDDASTESDYVCLSISDTGVGMDEAVLSRIFEPFYSTKQTKHGGGLGLAVVHGIVEQHGGKIDVESKKGVGTTFRVYLPAVLDVSPQRPKSIPLGELTGKGAEVLLVEDEDSVKNLFVRILTENGYKVTTTTTLEEARKAFEARNGAFTLLLADLALPDGSGIDLANELRARNSDLAVVLTSGYTDQAGLLRDFGDQGFEFVAKPFSVVELLRTLARVISSSKHNSTGAEWQDQVSATRSQS